MSKPSQSKEEAQIESAESNSDSDLETTTDDHPVKLEQQMVFGEDGDLKPDSESVETSLEAFGAEVDHRERSARMAEPAASEFGVDDRTKVTEATESDQRSLFSDVENDQQTLSGDDAANQCLFENESKSDDVDAGNGQ